MKPKKGTSTDLLLPEQQPELTRLKLTLPEQRHNPSAENASGSKTRWQRQQETKKALEASQAPVLQEAALTSRPVAIMPSKRKNKSKPAKQQSLKKAGSSVIPPPKKRLSRVDKALALAGVTSSLPRSKQPDLLVKASFEKHLVNIVDGKHGKLMLHVRRGCLLKTAGHCSVCFTSAAPLTRYADSNYGPVVLCSVCKVTAFETSFGHADAMPLKVDHAHAHRGKW